MIAANCSGELNQGSFLIDYTFNLHFNIYAGVTVSDIGGGFSSGFLKTSDVAVTSGVRAKFLILMEPASSWPIQTPTIPNRRCFTHRQHIFAEPSIKRQSSPNCVFIKQSIRLLSFLRHPKDQNGLAKHCVGTTCPRKAEQ